MFLFCPRCGRKLKVPDAWGGQQARCANCAKTIPVPFAGAQAWLRTAELADRDSHPADPVYLSPVHWWDDPSAAGDGPEGVVHAPGPAAPPPALPPALPHASAPPHLPPRAAIGAVMTAEIINNAHLAEWAVPSPDANWAQIGQFARSFNGFDYRRDCAALANRVADTYHAEGRLPAGLGLSDARACLFYEHQRWAQWGRTPTYAGLAYIRALVANIRQAIRLRSTA